MTTKKPDPLTDLGAICRDDRCDISGVHLVHEISQKRRGRPPKVKVHHSQVVARSPEPPKAKKRGWHMCRACGGRGVHRTTKEVCAPCEGRGSIFVGPRPPTGRRLTHPQHLPQGTRRPKPMPKSESRRGHHFKRPK